MDGDARSVEVNSITTSAKAPSVSIVDQVDLQKSRVDESIDTNADQPQKVQKTAGFFDVISNLATGVSSASQSVLAQAKEVGKSVQKSIEEKSILGDFNKMQQEFIQTKQHHHASSGALPWVGANNEDQLRAHILDLSKDKRNFIREPPSGASYDFDLNSSMPVAAALLREDPNLEKMRFELVPKTLSENNFWRNYFYRVSLVKQSSALSEEGASNAMDKGQELNRDDISVASNLDLMDGSVVGDSDTHPDGTTPDAAAVLAPALKCHPKPKPVQFSAGSDKASDDGWEQELQQTLDTYEVVGGDVAEDELDLETPSKHV